MNENTLAPINSEKTLKLCGAQTPPPNSRLPDSWVSALFARFTAIYNTEWTRKFLTEEARNLAKREWAEGLAGTEGKVIGEALDYCRNHLKWAPTIFEFKSICEERKFNFPEESEAFQQAVKRHSYKARCHPAVELAYLEVGNWDFSHDNEFTLKQKFKEAYRIAQSLCKNEPSRYFNDKAILSSGKVDKLLPYHEHIDHDRNPPLYPGTNSFSESTKVQESEKFQKEEKSTSKIPRMTSLKECLETYQKMTLDERVDFHAQVQSKVKKEMTDEAFMLKTGEMKYCSAQKCSEYGKPNSGEVFYCKRHFNFRGATI